MHYYNSFKNIINNVSFIAGIPSLSSWVLGKFNFNEMQVFFVTLAIVWVLSIEFRIKDLERVKKRK